MGKCINEVDEGNKKEQHKYSICFKDFESNLFLSEHYMVCKRTLQCKKCKEYSDNVADFEKHR